MFLIVGVNTFESEFTLCKPYSDPIIYHAKYLSHKIKLFSLSHSSLDDPLYLLLYQILFFSTDSFDSQRRARRLFFLHNYHFSVASIILIHSGVYRQRLL